MTTRGLTSDADDDAGVGWAAVWAGGTREGYRRLGRRHDRRIALAIVRRWTEQPISREDTPAMFDRLFGTKEQDPAIADRIPPGQYKTDKFPVLHYGSVPHTDLATWDFKVWGEVDSPFTLTWQQFKELPRKTVQTDIHCVTRWSKLDTTWEGVPIQAILEMAAVRPGATHVVSHAEQGYTANVPLSVLDDDDVLLADTFGGQPLELEHGYPLRLLIPKRYFWKSSKWVRGLEFLDHDQLGFWERYGYNNDADPWKEERFSE
jgi:DMSO/TMAO reductase YedYZ molybdopterin-dependent catalytic subunit